MGCVQSSTAASVAVPDPQRRRLSVLKGGVPLGAVGIGSSDAGHQQQNNNKVESLLELMPQGEKRFSLVGQQATGTQKGFEDKTKAVATTNIAKESLNPSIFGIGYACKKGLKPESPNQDDFFVMQVDNTCGLYGVFDGHGPYGHEISHFAHQLLPAVLLRSETFKSDPKEALRKAFLKTHAQTVKAQERNVFDCSLSGTTGTVVYFSSQDDALYVGHVGDSRAVMGKVVQDANKPTFFDLTQDHKPSNPEEKQRIHANGGQVRCLNGDINDRVFLKNKLYPGLAMSRSIGDMVGASAGVIAEPDVNSFPVTEADDFFLVASDGVWEFIPSSEACEIVRKKSEEFAGDAMRVTEALAQQAWDLWVQNEGNVVDDITVILVYLKGSKYYKGATSAASLGVVGSTPEEKSDAILLDHSQ